MIELRRGKTGRVLRIGHRGAPFFAAENTVRSFRAAVTEGVDLVEFDVLDLPRGPLIVAHSDHLDEVSHGRATGLVRACSLEELREHSPELATLDDALGYFCDEARDVGLHVDLKLRTRLDELVEGLRRHGLEQRTVVSSFHVPSLTAIARASRTVRIGFTYPEDRFGVSRRPILWPLVRAGLSTMRTSVPPRIPSFLRRAGASALMLNQALVTRRAVKVAHRLDVPVLAWTVDQPDDLERVLAAGVDGVVTNDPRVFDALGEGDKT